jgi:hypothetical protein
MGALAVMVEEPERDRFRFDDDNPVMNGLTLAESWFRELPEYAMDAVLHMGVMPEQWNELVEQGTVFENRALDGWHWKPEDRRNSRRGPLREGWPGAAR